MYKILVLIILFFISQDTISQQNNLAKVSIVNGVEVYILNEPVRPYEIVFGKKQGTDWTGFLSDGIINNSISTQVEIFVNKAIRKSKNKGRTFDAIIYISSSSIIAVKFTDLPTDQTYLKAKVHSLNGIPVFAMCKPLNDFNIVMSKGIGLKLALKYYTIDYNLRQFTRRFKKQIRNNKIDALYYTDGKSCDAILF